MRALLSSAFVLCLGLISVTPRIALADAECVSGNCGTPDQSGGGCGCGCGCSVLVAMTDRGDTYQFADDFDGDGLEDEFDNCPFSSNYEQIDNDSDGIGDSCDVCSGMADPDQADLDGNGVGDACSDDIDGDSILNAGDNCPRLPNSGQQDTDHNGLGDLCDSDFLDACRLNPSGEGCEDDWDGDGVSNDNDSCPVIQNGDRLDTDLDGLGDACDQDADNDGIANIHDNCKTLANPGQVDLDGDGLGDGGVWGSGAESCDQRECYAVPGKDDCLDPNAAFRIDMAAIDKMGQFFVDDTIILVMLTNRLQATHQWTARFDKLPQDSQAQLVNAKGAASTLGRSPQVANCLRQGDDGSCSEMNSLRFTPDEPGEYVIKVTAELPRGDERGIGPATATATITTKIAGKAAGGCNAAGGAGAFGAVLLGLLALVNRRRR